jgi:hypothetical protein
MSLAERDQLCLIEDVYSEVRGRLGLPPGWYGPLSLERIKQLCRQGKGPPVERFARRYFVRPSELELWLRTRYGIWSTPSKPWPQRCWES